MSLQPDAPADSGLVLRPSEVRRVSGLREAGSTALALAGLVLVDLLVRFRGFRGLYQWLRSWPVRGTLQDAARALEICSAVDRAAGLYFKRAWCLQRSATATALLRQAGFPAELVIGVQKMPFSAHAWVELGGQVANDLPGVRGLYEVIDRLRPPSPDRGSS